MSVQYELRPYGAGSMAPANDLARLHSALLPDSPVARLGRRFLRTYYESLPRADCLFGAVAYADGDPVGFVAATEDSDGFMRDGLRRELPHMGWALAWALASRPRSAYSLWEAWAIQRSRENGGARPDAGEILTFVGEP